MAASKKSTARNWTDPDDAPELDDAWFDKADLYVGEKLVRRGRPPSASPKELVSMRLDREVVAHYRESGRGWQTRINAVLRKVAHLPEASPRKAATIRKSARKVAHKTVAKKVAKASPKRPGRR